MFLYALTIFIGAFLLFQVQPLIGKYILPWFGGGPGVWTTCLMFFQALLLGGYAYAHFTSRFLKARPQAVLHLVLLLGALATLPIIPADSWKPVGQENPTRTILVLLTVCLGLPYLVLSSTGPLLQQWFSRTRPGASPYRLYALSNAGSLLALVSYPFVVEPNLTRRAQAETWGWLFAGFVIACGLCAVRLWRANPRPLEDEIPKALGDGTPNRPSVFNRALWLLWPACASVLLLAVTNKISQDVAVIPFLWVLPLALYLLSFIICFDHPRWYARLPFSLALVAALGGMVWVLFQDTDAALRTQIFLYTGGLFVCCMVCHGELYRLRPDPRHLTEFYLLIAAGGALGGLFVALVAPLVFTDHYELHWGLLACGLLFLVVCLRERPPANPAAWRWVACALTLAVFGGLDTALVGLGQQYPGATTGRLTALRVGMWGALLAMVAVWIARRQFGKFQYWRGLACAWLILGWLGLAGALAFQVHESRENVVSRSRNFYGTLKVFEYHQGDPLRHYRLLQHGGITHGLQFVDPLQANWLTTYYSESSGVARAVRALPETSRRIGVVGLGTGSMCLHARAGDYLRIYEIDPDVQTVAAAQFTYVSQCPAKVEIAPGDGRLSLEREPAQNFDLLVLDAFSSDAIPVHLLTREAFEVYERHLKPGGVIAVHISNHYLNLEPVVANLARHFGYQLAVIHADEESGDGEYEGEWWLYASTWVLLTRNEEFIRSPAITNSASALKESKTAIPLWTDDFASLFQILN